jgi:CYTH domain-containing protein
VVSRNPGDGRYAQFEREQRWILEGRPDDLEQPVSIVDLYIRGTRLRLRRVENAAEVVFKLGQKVRPEPSSPEVVKLTNIYLSEPEYGVLAKLGGDKILKTRWRWAPGERTLTVDVFGGDLTGLILAEVELQPGERRLNGPPLMVADVTDDGRFSGGSLAVTTATDVRDLLAVFGVPR